MKSISDLLSRSIEVRDETEEKHNTAYRIGSLFYDIVDYLQNVCLNTSITTETTTRENADKALQTTIDTLTTRVDDLENSVSDHTTSIDSCSSSITDLEELVATKPRVVELYSQYGDGVNSSGQPVGLVPIYKETITFYKEPTVFTAKGNVATFNVYHADAGIEGLTENNNYYLFKVNSYDSNDNVDGVYLAYEVGAPVIETSLDDITTYTYTGTFVKKWSNEDVPDAILKALGEQWATAISGNANNIFDKTIEGTLNYNVANILTTLKDKVVDIS